MVIDFKCQKCYKILPSRDLLRKHEAQCYTSENEEIQVESPLDKTCKIGKPYGCKNCDKRFAQKAI